MRCLHLALRPVRLALYTVLLTTAMVLPGPQADAAIHITNVSPSGRSNVVGLTATTVTTGTPSPGTSPTPTPSPTTNGLVSIYGGLAGADCTGGGSTVCDSCAAAAGLSGDVGLIPCNKTRISDTVQLQITYYSDSITTSESPVLEDANNAIIPITSPGPVGARTPVTITASWKDLCFHFNPSLGTCGSGNATFRLGFSASGTFQAGDDQTNISVTVATGDINAMSIQTDCSTSPTEGICHFELNSGDSSATIKSLGPSTAFPNSSNGANYSELHFLYATSATAPADPTLPATINAASPFIPIPLGANGSTAQSDRLEGLTNDLFYWFKVASVDLAGNIGYYTGTANDSGTTACSQFYSTLAPMTTSCHVVLPGVIDGVLTNSVNCFIATAAYGSPMSERVNTFRNFRDRFLIKNHWTRKLVSLYYHYSPEYAHWLAKSDSARAIARVFLWPAWAFAWVALQAGLSQAFLLLITLMLLPLVLLKRKQLVFKTAFKQWRS
jgi:hypothetical protein